MKNQLCYVTVIAFISILLITVVGSAEARTYDKEAEYTLSGFGVFLFGNADTDRINVQIFPIEDTKDLSVWFDGIVNGESFNKKCFAPKQILKVSGTNKASAKFNTADLICSRNNGPETIVSVTLVGTGEVFQNEKYDLIECHDISDGVQKCIREHGSLTAYVSDGSISGYGITIDDTFGEIRNVKVRHTEWTTP